MKIAKAELEKALECSAAIMGRRTTLPIVACVKISAEKNRLTAAASNLDEYCETIVECDGVLKPVCVPYSSLKNIFPILGDSVEIEAKNGRLIIKSNGTFSLNTFDAKEFPPMPEGKFKKIGLNCVDLAVAIETVSFAASQDEGRHALMAVHVVCEAKKIIAEACNGRELARVEKNSIAAESEFQVWNGFAKNFTAHLGNKKAVLELSERWVSVTHENGSYFCKGVETPYPNTSHFLKWDHEQLGSIDPAKWIPFFRTAVALDGADQKLTSRVFIKDGRIKHESKSGELDLPVPEKIKDAELRLNAIALLPGLQRFESGKVALSIANENAVCMKQGDLTILSSMLGKTS